jgi:hypothetical protein
MLSSRERFSQSGSQPVSYISNSRGGSCNCNPPGSYFGGTEFEFGWDTVILTVASRDFAHPCGSPL